MGGNPADRLATATRKPSAGASPRSSTPASRDRPSKVDAPPAPQSAPQASTPRVDDETAGLQALLNLEEAIRNAENERELFFLIANEVRRWTNAAQAFVFTGSRKFKASCISGLSGIDRSAPLVEDFEQLAGSLSQKRSDVGIAESDLSKVMPAGAKALSSYPYRSILWLPIRLRSGTVIGGLLLTRSTPFPDSAKAMATRLSKAFAHALGLLIAEPRIAERLKKSVSQHKKWLLLAAVTAVTVLVIPVTMTTVAPLEVSPRDPFVVAAPIEGVIEDVLVEPNATVTADQKVVRLADTVLRNRLEVSEREMRVAEAKLKKATQLAFDEAQGRQEMGIALADHSLKAAERDFAREVLERSTITVPKAGIALYPDRRELLGKPVALGERIMLIADPVQVELIINVAVADAIILEPGTRVKVFLDSEPLRAREAVIELADYKARPWNDNYQSFRVVARLTDGEAPPRLGIRGTAQLYGDRVTLFYYLFRRPLASARQWLGL